MIWDSRLASLFRHVSRAASAENIQSSGREEWKIIFITRTSVRDRRFTVLIKTLSFSTGEERGHFDC